MTEPLQPVHTRHELPFLTGRRRPLADVVADLP